MVCSLAPLLSVVLGVAIVLSFFLFTVGVELKCLVFPHIFCEAVGYVLVKVIHYMGLEHWVVYSFACLACILVLQCFEHCFLLLPDVVNKPVHLTVSLFHSVVCSVVLSVSQVSLIGRQSGSFLQQ